MSPLETTEGLMPTFHTANRTAQGGLRLIEAAICELLSVRPGLGNSEIARALSLESFSEKIDGKTTGENFLTHAILCAMVRENIVERSDDHHPRYSLRRDG
jgi:hypothetical protein